MYAARLQAALPMRAVTLRLRVAKLRPRATAVDVARESDAWGGAEQCSSSDSVGDARFALKQKRKESVLQNFLGGALPAASAAGTRITVAQLEELAVDGSR